MFSFKKSCDWHIPILEADVCFKQLVFVLTDKVWQTTLDMAALFRRLLFSAVALLAVCSFSFFLIHAVPGDPVDLILGDQASAAQRLSLQHELGLDRSLGQQYIQFFWHLLQGDLGRSLHSRQPVVHHLLQALPATFLLAFFALLMAVIWGVTAGFICVLKRGRLEAFLNTLSLVLMSLPVFFVAPLLIWFFAIKLSWLPVSEMGDLRTFSGWKHLILPAVSLALPLGAILLKISRAALLEVINKNYIRTAHSKGLSTMDVYLKHAFKNSLISIVTVIGLQSSALLTGTVIVESIFDWPGIGLLLLESIQRRDYPLVQAAVMFIAVVYILVNLITDLVYLYLHPQIRSL